MKRIRPAYPIGWVALALGLLLALGPAAGLARAAPSTTITVNTTADDNVVNGNCTLREAITAANTDAATDACPAGSGADVIAFNIGTGVVTITLGSQLPAITSAVRVDGSTQPGYSGTPLVRLDYNGTALLLNFAANVTIQDLDLSYRRGGYSGTALSISSSTNVTVSHVLATDRSTGITVGGGQDIRVLSSDLRRSGWVGNYALVLSGVTAGSLPGGVLIWGNLYGDSTNGVSLQTMSNLTISDGGLGGSNVVISDTSGLNRTSGTALKVNGVTNCTVDGLDLSDVVANGTIGLDVDGSTGVTLAHLTAASRSWGADIGTSSNVLVQDSDLGNGAVSSGNALYLTSCTNATVQRIMTPNRNRGIYVNGGQDVRILNNDLRGAGGGAGGGAALEIVNVTPGSLPGGVLVTGNTFGNSANGIRLQSMSGFKISDGSLPGSHVVLADTCGLNSITGIALYLNNMPNVSLDSLVLSYLSGYSGDGLQIYSSNNVTVTNSVAAYRTNGIYVNGGRDVRIWNNDLRYSGNGSGAGLYLYGVTAGGILPAGVSVTGNLYGDSANAVRIQSVSNLVISDGSLPGSHVILADTSGLNRTSGTALYLGGNINATLDGLDLSNTLGGSGNYGAYINACTNLTAAHLTAASRGWGIYVTASSNTTIQDSDVGNGATTSGNGMHIINSTNTLVTRVSASRRNMGIYASGGQDVRIVGNDLRGAGYGAGYGMYLYNVSAGSLPGGVLVTGNLYGDSANGVAVDTMTGLIVSDGGLAGTHVTISDTSGLNRTSGTALYLHDATNATIGGLDLSYVVGGLGTYGLNSVDSINLLVSGVAAANRGYGLYIYGGRDVRVLGNDLRTAGHTDGIGGYGLDMSNVAASSLPGGVSISGNRYGSADNGVRFQNMNNLTISDGSRAGSNVVISDTSGLTRTTFTAMYLSNVPNVTIDNLDFSATGSGSYGLRASSCSHLTVTNSTVSFRTWGVEVTSGTTTRVDCTAFCRNSVGFYSTSTATDTILWNDLIQGNSVTGVRNGTVPLIVAENNYWGAADGPSNLGGSGDSYQGNVDAAPFLSASPTCVVIPAPCIPTAVRLVSFTAAGRPGSVLVAWETATEWDNAGFNLYRREIGADTYTPLNTVLIPSQAPGGGGASYTFVDEEVEPGVAYEYLLEAVDVHGRPTAHGPVEGTAPYVVWLPVIGDF